MDLFCSNCGNPLREGAKFCNKCGSKVNIEDTPSNNQEADSYTTPQMSDSNKIQNEENKSNNNSSQDPLIQPNLIASNNIETQPSFTINNQNNDSQIVENNSLSFGQILKNWWYGKFEGRCSRQEYWKTILCLLPFWLIIVIGLGLFSIPARLFTFPFDGFIIYLHKYTSFFKDISYFKLPFGVKFTVYIIFLLITIKPQISLNTRRLHDLNMSGYWQILFWLPIVVYVISCIILYSAIEDNSTIGFYTSLKNFKSLMALDSICSLISLFFGLYFAFAPGTKGPNKYGQPNNSNIQSVSNYASNFQNTSQQQAYINNQSNCSQIVENNSSTFGIVLKNWWKGNFEGRCSRQELWQTILCILPFWLITVIVLSLFSFSARFFTFPFDSIIIFLQKYTSLFKYNISNFHLPFVVDITIFIVFLLITIKPQISLNTRRLHDLNMSGYWQILFWLPIVVYVISCIILYSAIEDNSTIGFYTSLKNFKSLMALDSICSLISLFFGLYFAFAPGTKGPNKYGQPNNSNIQSVSNYASNFQNTSQQQAYNNDNQNNISQIPENNSPTFGTALKNWCVEKLNIIRSKFESCKNYLEEKNMAYPNACELMNGNIEDCREAIKLFMSVKFYYADSESKIKECEKRIEELEKEEIIKKQKEQTERKKDIAPEEKKETEIEFNNIEQKVENKQEVQLETKVEKEIEAKQETQPETEVEKEIEAKQEAQPETDEDSDEEESQNNKKTVFKIFVLTIFLFLIIDAVLYVNYLKITKEKKDTVEIEKQTRVDQIRIEKQRENSELQNKVEDLNDYEECEPIELHIQVAAESMIEDLNTVTGIELIKCDTGSFIMGSSINEPGRNKDEQQHKVIISNTFYIGKYEVTQKIYEAVVGNNPSKFKDPNKPVESVSWDDAVKFCEILNNKYSRYIPSGYKFDLPTEAQWEYACRAGTNTTLNNGKNLTTINGACPNLNEIAWYDKNANGTTHKVGQKKPNAWGIYDMHGNVWEWCKDLYGEYPTEYVTDPAGAKSGSSRVYRGGSWGNNASFSRSSYRCSSESDLKRMRLGFRVALVLDQNYLLNIGDNWERAIPSKRSVSEIPNNITYKKYTNVRFGYSIDYPDFMIPNGESDNGDGQRFYFDSETYFAVWASYNMDGIENEYNLSKESTDSYTVLKKNWFIRSGIDSTNHIYYRRTVLDTNIFCTIYFYYPSESKTKFDKIINDVTKSIKVSLGNNTR